MELKQMFNPESAWALATALQHEYPEFDADGFMQQVFADGWEDLELKQRMRRISTVAHDFLPEEYHAALAILRHAAPHLPEYGFEKMVFSDFVEVYGLEDWDASIPALEEFTKLVSAEFAVRPFLIRYGERMIGQMLAWAKHPDERVRRLASEGCRPRLPWAMRVPALIADPSPIVPILELLKDDEAETVRRSVANNLNDIAKDHPDLVIKVLRRWQANPSDTTQRLISHALRTLVKQGHGEALDLLGVDGKVAISVRNVKLEPPVVPMGGQATFSFEVESLSERPQNLVIDYIVYYQKANGKLLSKVFKLSKVTLPPGVTLPVKKSISFRPITTRVYYPGPHAIEAQINGQLFGRLDFTVS